MKTLLAFILLTLLISGCDSQTDTKEETKETKTVQPEKPVLMSTQTELKSAEYLTAKINIPTAVCNMCEENITNAIKKLDGVIETSADTKKKVAIITIDGGRLSFERVRLAISNAGYDADSVKRNPVAYEKLDECCKTESTKKI